MLFQWATQQCTETGATGTLPLLLVQLRDIHQQLGMDAEQVLAATESCDICNTTCIRHSATYLSFYCFLASHLSPYYLISLPSSNVPQYLSVLSIILSVIDPAIL